MALNGATAAGEFIPTGELVAYNGDLSEEHAEMVAMMCCEFLNGQNASEKLHITYRDELVTI